MPLSVDPILDALNEEEARHGLLVIDPIHFTPDGKVVMDLSWTPQKIKF